MTDTLVEEKKLSFDVNQIMEMIPHRYPFLLVDRITECVTGKYSKGYKNLTANEMFFQGHFPNHPVMPGVLQLEAMAQCAAPILYTDDKYKNKLAMFAKVDNARFRGIVTPGDRLDMEITLTKIKGPIAACIGKGYVDGKLVVEAELTLYLQ